ncbi:hypothetical protein [Wenxinia marina]|uniref:Translocase n=1 Tax=Wenxinia marina DSM 24838 TaxID=1123501 RepID=A0A0D0NRZ2_9RHOB|nr:hypothetical protein [Wenxinia marina]KIQ71005.1 hypothetical protein Wenmar_00383 [Wenxinia marina DSM 24838]GGL55613.1 hypothetical protein GCM10011392_07510 [Wenxinia marina]
MKARARKYLIVGGTFSVALGIGFVMQNGDALAARFGAEGRPGPVAVDDAARVVPRSGVQVTEVAPSAVPEAGAETEVVAEVPAVPPTPDVPTLTALQLPTPLSDGMTDLRLPVLLTDFATDTLDALSELSLAAATGVSRLGERTAAEDVAVYAPAADRPADIVPASADAESDACEIDMRATAAPAAMVTLAVSAPCHPQSELTIHHQGMIFSAMTGDDGTVSLSVPALSENAIFIAEIEGDGAAASTDVPDLATFERAVLQWQGTSGLGLHALEDGAGYGQPGHVSATTARGAEAALTGTGGFVTALGDAAVPDAYHAEIYTYPAAMTADHDVILNVEAVVLPDNCGRPIAAQTIQIAPGVPPTAHDLTMTLPGCEAVGEYLVLSNMLRDLTLAMR